ncbi:hypothetical protein Glove_457g84 [Diversispora epigaea]|uniref:Uncharacterized protein n=1 Tax=Diversispora epigaea TaxID=1348612 RepID=A0A397GSW8_9GLOM|nr:hypothetical protein Glove_457g84 [Diversispora epigaea]
MANTQSKINSLEEQISKLVAENNKLRRENAEFLTKETGLIARIAELERSAKENAENANLRDAELNVRISNLEQKQSQTDKEKSDLIVLRSEDTSESKLDDDIPGIGQSSIQNISTETENSNGTPKQIEFLHSENDTPASNISDNSSNSDVQKVTKSQISGSPIHAEWAEPRVFDSSISPEDKEIIEFLDLKEKKRAQEVFSEKQDTSGELEELISSPISCDTKTVNGVYDQVKASSNESVQNLSEKSIGDSNLITEIVQASKARKKSIKAKQEEISSWGRYSEKFEDKVINLRAEDKNLKDKTARSQIYNEMKPYLTGISDEYLRKITSKSRKILKLFGWDYDPITLKKVNGIGWHMINQVIYSADTILRFTNLQIQYIVDQVTLAQAGMTVTESVNTVHDQTKTGVSTPTKMNVLTKSTDLKTKSEAKKTLPDNPKNDRSHIINKVLERYPNISLRDSDNYFDSYVISVGLHDDAYKIADSLSLCPACSQYHRESIRSGYREGSYYINCLFNPNEKGIEITAKA